VSLVYVNGKQTYFKGVNTQDTHPLYGRSIDVPTMLKDITMMKQANMNIVRTSHYPRQPKLFAIPNPDTHIAQRSTPGNC
jgi:beta-galactosidase